MKKEMEFFIYLIENYANYKKKSTDEIIEQLEKFNLINKIYDMYEIYHQEALENAYDDIDQMIENEKNFFN